MIITSVDTTASLSVTILRFLREHPDDVFCGRCLALKLTGRRHVSSSAICGVEGLGARRVYGRCSACGAPRLVAAVAK